MATQAITNHKDNETCACAAYPNPTETVRLAKTTGRLIAVEELGNSAADRWVAASLENVTEIQINYDARSQKQRRYGLRETHKEGLDVKNLSQDAYG